MAGESSMTEATGEEGDVSMLYHAADGSNAQQEAKACGKRIERRGRSFEVVMPGSLDIVAGMNVTLFGFRDGISGEWVAKIVRHSVSRSGWKTTIQGEGVDGDFLQQKQKRLGGKFQPQAKISTK